MDVMRWCEVIWFGRWDSVLMRMFMLGVVSCEVKSRVMLDINRTETDSDERASKTE